MATHPYQPGLLFFSPGLDDENTNILPPPPESDNSEFTAIQNKKERADRIARALTAGVEGADTNRLAQLILEGLRGEDI